jgi:hypothetical protein
MSSAIPEGTIPFLLYLILKYGVDGGKICNLCGAGELFINLTFRVCVFKVSNPANFTTEGLAPKMPLDPTLSYTSIMLNIKGAYSF